jgi:hypothetical protein
MVPGANRQPGLAARTGAPAIASEGLLPVCCFHPLKVTRHPLSVKQQKTETKNGAWTGFRYFDLCNGFLRLLAQGQFTARKGREEGTGNGHLM